MKNQNRKMKKTILRRARIARDAQMAAEQLVRILSPNEDGTWSEEGRDSIASMREINAEDAEALEALDALESGRESSVLVGFFRLELC